MRSLIYYLTVATLLAHELDAVKHAEWELLYLLRDLSDGSGYTAFVLLHIPLIVCILWLSNHRVDNWRTSFRYLLCMFAIGHAAIHSHLHGSENYLFEGWLADSLILGAAALGVTYCALDLAHRLRKSPPKAPSQSRGS